MKYFVIMVSSLMIYSATANAQSDAEKVRGEGQAAKSSLFGGTAASQEQPCRLPASKHYRHRHVYDEDAYLRRISYKQ